MIRKAQSGFTLIEMVILIVVLGILAAAGIPRFINMSTDALRSSVAGTAASLQEAIILMQATVTAKGLRGPLNDVSGFGDGTVDINSVGFPTDTASANPINNDAVTSAKCLNAWNGILQNPPYRHYQRRRIQRNHSPGLPGTGVWGRHQPPVPLYLPEGGQPSPAI